MVLSKAPVPIAAATMLLATMSSPALAEPPSPGDPPPADDVEADGPFSHSTGAPARAADDASDPDRLTAIARNVLWPWRRSPPALRRPVAALIVGGRLETRLGLLLTFASPAR